MVDNKKPWTLAELYALPRKSADHPPRLRRGLERDRHWQAPRCREFLKRDRRRYARQICLVSLRRGLFHPIDMPTALHPQTQMTFKFDDQILPRKPTASR